MRETLFLLILTCSGCWTTITDPDTHAECQPQPITLSRDPSLRVRVIPFWEAAPVTSLVGWNRPYRPPEETGSRVTAALQVQGHYIARTGYESRDTDAYLAWRIDLDHVDGTPRGLPKWLTGPGDWGYKACGALFPLPFSKQSTYSLKVAIYGADRQLIGSEEKHVLIDTGGLFVYCGQDEVRHDRIIPRFLPGFAAATLARYRPQIQAHEGHEGPFDPPQNPTRYLLELWKRTMLDAARSNAELGVFHYLWGTYGQDQLRRFLDLQLGYQREPEPYCIRFLTRGPHGESFVLPRQLQGKEWLTRFAAVAWPKEYRPGRCTYVLDGAPALELTASRILRKDLGPRTGELMQGIDRVPNLAGWQEILRRNPAADEHVGPRGWMLSPALSTSSESKGG